MKNIEIKELSLGELSKKGRHTQLVEVLSALAPCYLTDELEFRKLLLRRIQRGFKTFLLLEDDIIKATASFFMDEKFLYNGEAVGYIEEVAVHRDSQKQGYGLTIVKHLVQLGRQEGCRKLVLYCDESLIPFYEKAGFKSDATLMVIRYNE